MLNLDRLEEIMTNMLRNPLRTILTAMGVFWGIYMLVVTIGSGKGLQNGVNSNFGGFNVSAIYIWPQRTTMPYKGLQPGRYYAFRNADARAIVEQVPEIQYFSPRLQLGGYGQGNNVGRGVKTGSYSVYGDSPDYRYVQLLDIWKGRFVNQTDIDEKRKTCVIGQTVAEELFEPQEDPIGEYIKIQGVFFKVVGVVKTNKQGREAQQDLTSIHVPLSTFQQAFNRGDVLGWFNLSVKPGYNSFEVDQKVRSILMKQHKINPADKRAIGGFNAAQMSERFDRLFMGIDFIIILVGLGTLFAGGVGVMNIMLITVNERTKEIGIRKAMGATPWSVLSMIMQESMFITIMSGFIGLALGVLTLEVIDMLVGVPAGGGGRRDFTFFLHPEVGFNTAMFSVTVLVVIGLLAGLYPSLKAVRIDPIKALRTE